MSLITVLIIKSSPATQLILLLPVHVPYHSADNKIIPSNTTDTTSTGPFLMRSVMAGKEIDSKVGLCALTIPVGHEVESEAGTCTDLSGGSRGRKRGWDVHRSFRRVTKIKVRLARGSCTDHFGGSRDRKRGCLFRHRLRSLLSIVNLCLAEF